ncbi:hypothetical protein LY632_13540 [Erythrobacter sp. SDW2]|uniref:hypothetical protein n=1 Tax=Erythrobacter sp. SDW2 TaxID=2907154 RepID=UPI001F314CD9|nr:hypothetical protein [Erythrobacter sp. SDW2]UIP06688.1 hypothetical protein LY632_13540 [Erythrobacter sp. SDW2]
MSTLLDRRRMLGFIGAGGVLSLVPLEAVLAQGAASPDLRGLVWDRQRAEKNWRRNGGPLWIVHDRVAMKLEGVVRDPLKAPLSAVQRTDILAALVAASSYYKARGLPAPDLPLDENDAFNIFFIDLDQNTNGGTGDASGPPNRDSGILGYGLTSDLKVEENAPTVPAGTHMMMSGPALLAPDYPEQGWVTLAHELGHAVDASIAAVRTWPVEEGKEILWLGEGSTHSIAPFALKSLGFEPVPAWKSGEWKFAKEVGRRPYDVSLPLKQVPKRRPSWVIAKDPATKDRDEAERSDYFWTKNATYLTCGFFRWLFQEEAPIKIRTSVEKAQPVQFPLMPGAPSMTRPGDFELFQPFRYTEVTAADVAKVQANPKWIDEGVAMLDRFLRKHHPAWAPTGLYRAFPAFVAHFVGWPDDVGDTRDGFFAHEKWLDSLFMDGVPTPDIAMGQDIDIELKPIAPLAARAVKFKIPPIPGNVGGKYPSITITAISLDGRKNAIDDIHIGLNGNVLANSLSHPIRNGNGKVRRWYNVNARPLQVAKTHGETVLTIINSASDIAKGRPLRVRLHIALQVGTADGQVSYHPLPTTDDQGRTIPLPSSVSPPMNKVTPTAPVARGSDDIRITIAQDADLVTMMDLAASNNLMGLSVQRKTDAPPDTRAAEAAKALASLQSMARPTRKMGLVVSLVMPRVEPGVVGAVAGGKVGAEWIDPVYVPYAKYGVSSDVSLETDAVQIIITSNTEGTIVGRFVADFDKGSQNTEREFRGKIEGNFSVGIVIDDQQGDGDLPEDPTSLLPTDWFIACARAGIDTATMGQMMRDAISASDDGSGSAGAFSGSGTDSGSSRLVGEDPVTCEFKSEAEMRMALDRYLKQMRETVPGITPEQLRAMREAMLASPETTAAILCEAGV